MEAGARAEEHLCAWHGRHTQDARQGYVLHSNKVLPPVSEENLERTRRDARLAGGVGCHVDDILHLQQHISGSVHSMGMGSVPRQAAKRLWKHNECKGKAPVRGRQATTNKTKTKTAQQATTTSVTPMHSQAHDAESNGTTRAAKKQQSPFMPRIQLLLGTSAARREHSPPTRSQISSTPRIPPPPLQHTTKTPNTHTRRSSQRRAQLRPRRGPQRGGVPQGSPRGRPTRQCGRPARRSGRPRRPYPASAGRRGRRGAAAAAAATTRPSPATDATGKRHEGERDGPSSLREGGSQARGALCRAAAGGWMQRSLRRPSTYWPARATKIFVGDAQISTRTRSM